ncbi:hypothetical protein SPHINGOR109_11334 [Sphingorhabdus sp. 109]|nr:hypothetical protein SPHINGOR109_11334 [Sphingorhabdus sp. 109]
MLPDIEANQSPFFRLAYLRSMQLWLGKIQEQPSGRPLWAPLHRRRSRLMPACAATCSKSIIIWPAACC